MWLIRPRCQWPSKTTHFEGRIAAAARFPDEIESIREASASIVFNLSAVAGLGVAEHVAHELD